MPLDRHQALAEIEASLDRQESLMENHREYGVLFWGATKAAIPCDSSPSEAQQASRVLSDEEQARIARNDALDAAWDAHQRYESGFAE